MGRCVLVVMVGCKMMDKEFLKKCKGKLSGLISKCTDCSEFGKIVQRIRRRRSGQLQRGTKASSDSELAHEDVGGRSERRYNQEVADVGPRGKCYFHEGVDVDQLARYRRRRVQLPRINLDLLQSADEDEEDEEDKRRRLVTEYRLAFRASSDDVFRSSEDFLSPVRTKRQTDVYTSEQIEKDNDSAEDKRASLNYVPLVNSNSYIDQTKSKNIATTIKTQSDIEFERIVNMETETTRKAHPTRRGTSLKYEGDFSSATEYSTFVPYPGFHRSEQKRRGTTLKMEGEFDSRTEKNEKFIEWPAGSCSKRDLIRLPTHLRLEGDLETSTESHEKYVPFVGARRPEILRQTAHLKLEGDSSWMPEYNDVFREYDLVERSAPKIPEPNLKTGGGFYEKTETKEFFKDPRNKETELMFESIKNAEEEEEKKRKEEEEKQNNQRKEEELKLLVSKLEDLKGPSLEIPEYKDAYKDFPRERPRIMKPEDEIGRADGTKVPSPTPSNSRFKTKIDQDPEYKSIYLHSSDERPIYHRPPLSLRPSGVSSSRSSFARPSIDYHRRDSKRSDIALSEIRSQYVNYGHVPRTETTRMPANLRLEGNINMDPEYRDAYRGTSEYQMRYNNRSNSATRRNRDVNNYWITNNNSDNFGAVNAAEDQDSFQILHTKVHEESVVGKPPPGSRRNSRSSRAQPDITLTTDLSEPQSTIIRNRSPSPTYRLQVTNVDDEPRGFTKHRRSPSQSLLVQSSGHRSPSPIQQTSERPYSPSFAKESPSSVPRQQSFVVLDNDVTDNLLSRRRRTDRNYNLREGLLNIRGNNGHAMRPRNRTPPNWMPPWYDSSTSTI